MSAVVLPRIPRTQINHRCIPIQNLSYLLKDPSIIANNFSIPTFCFFLFSPAIFLFQFSIYQTIDKGLSSFFCPNPSETVAFVNAQNQSFPSFFATVCNLSTVPSTVEKGFLLLQYSDWKSKLVFMKSRHTKITPSKQIPVIFSLALCVRILLHLAR